MPQCLVWAPAARTQPPLRDGCCEQGRGGRVLAVSLYAPQAALEGEYEVRCNLPWEQELACASQPLMLVVLT